MTQYSTPITAADLGQTDSGFAGSSLLTGDIRRGYNFGSMVYELNPAVTSLFTLVSNINKTSTNDPSYKISEKRNAIHKRYAYVVGFKDWSGSGNAPTTGYTENSADISGLAVGTLNTHLALKMATDYKSAGNIQNVFGQSNGAISVGASGTTPIFFLENQVIRVNLFDEAGGANSTYQVTDFFEARIKSVVTSGNYAYLGVIVVRAVGDLSTDKYLTSFTDGTTPISTVYGTSISLHGSSVTNLESMRTYVMGTSFGEGSGYPGTWKQQKYSNRYFQTQIFKTAAEMSGTALATELKFEKNEWASIWGDKLMEHKWDIDYALHWAHLNTDSDGNKQTQGVCDFVLQYGNVFSLTTSKTKDEFLDDLANLTNPLYNNIRGMIFLAQPTFYQWLHKLGGYALNNLKIGVTSGSTTPAAHYIFDFSGQRDLFGSPVSTFNTMRGPMHVMEDQHLAGSQIKMLGLTMNNISYKYLKGNGYNRDTTVYPGAITVENSGIDKRMDLIQTEAGLEITLPETHAAWL